MKPHHAFDAERPLASHCPELFQVREEACDLGPRLAGLSEALAVTLAQGLAKLSGRDAPRVTFLEPRDLSADELLGMVAPLASNTVFGAGARRLPFIASLEAASVFRLVDRAFGGRGDVPRPLPEAFPLSAELFVSRLETVLATAISQALGPDNPAAIVAMERHGRLMRLLPHLAGAKLTLIELEVSEAVHDPWKVLLALPAATLEALLAQDLAATPAGSAKRAASNPAEAPFGDVPLTVSAMLVEMRIGFARLAALTPGDVLPVSVARNVPIRVGDRTIAHGTIGELDDRVAVQIIKAF